MVNYHEYPTSYNGTNVSSVSDFFLGYPTYVSGGVMIKVLPVFIFIALFALAMPFGVGAATVSAGFITLILSIYLWWNGVLSFVYPMAFLFITGIAAILVATQKGQ